MKETAAAIIAADPTISPDGPQWLQGHRGAAATPLADTARPRGRRVAAAMTTDRVGTRGGKGAKGSGRREGAAR